MVVTSNFSFPVGFSWVFSSFSSTSFFSRVRRGEVTSARFGMNFPKCVIMPKNCSIFAWSTFIRSDDIIRPRNTIDFTPIWHLFLFSFSQLLRIFKNTLFKRSSPPPPAIRSSWELALPGTSEIMEVTSRRKSFLAEWIPSGNLLKR